MSLRAMLWALEDAPVDDPASALILVALADRADDEGRDAYPARAWLARRGRCSVSTVARRLKRLEELGLIRRGDQTILDVRKVPTDRRPVVWDLCMDAGGGVSTSTCGVSVVTERGVSGDTGGVSVVNERGVSGDTQTVHNHPVLSNNSNAREDEQFEEWWKLFPTDHRVTGRSSKPAARKHFKKTLRQIDFDSLMEATRAYVLEREQQIASGESRRELTHNAQNWLSKDVWGAYVVDGAERMMECERLVAEGKPVELGKLLGVRVPVPNFEGSAFEVQPKIKSWLADWWASDGKKLVG